MAEAPTQLRDKRAGFVCVSRFSPEKGIEVLLEAWRRAFPDGGEGLMIVGSGELEHRLREAARVIPGVSFHEQIPLRRVSELLAQCRAAVIPSLCYESFSRVVAEAFLVGTPVIASRIGALGELVSNGSNGLLSEPGEPAALAENLSLIGTSDGLVSQLGRGAQLEFQTRFSPEVTTAKLLSIYEDAARRPRWETRSGSLLHDLEEA